MKDEQMKTMLFVAENVLFYMHCLLRQLEDEMESRIERQKAVKGYDPTSEV